MFVKTRRAVEDGWSIYTGVSEVHTDNDALSTFAEIEGIKFDRERFDVRENMRRPPEEEREAIDNHPQRQHGFCMITVEFFDDRRKPLKLLTNMRTYLCCDDGSTAQALVR